MATKNDFFREHILDQLQFDHLPEVKRAKLLDAIGGFAEQKLLLSIFAGLSEEKQGIFRSLLESGDENSVQSFVETNVPDFLNLLSAAVAETEKTLRQYGQS